MSRHASPTAQLLRNSRLFSIPQPLPRPIVEHIAGRDGSYRSSDSATTPFPLRQAIITPNSSASRGDWGLKRALPARAVKRSSEPVQNVIANDTYESITEYAQASGHVKTLQKFQELGIAMVRQDQKNSVRDSSPLSALEPAFDYTDKATAPPPVVSGQQRRWKFKNGAVRSMTPGEFQDFIKYEVKNQKGQFMKVLQARSHRQRLVHDRLALERALVSEGASEDETVVLAKIRYAKWVEELPAELLNRYLRTPEPGLSYTAVLKRAIDDRSDIQRVQGDVFGEALADKTPAEEVFAQKLDTESEGDMIKQFREQAETHRIGIKRMLGQALYCEPSKKLPKVVLPNFQPDSEHWKSWITLAHEAESNFLLAFQTKEWDMDGSYFANYLKILRNDTTLDSRLFNYVREFLDMPGISTRAMRTSNSTFAAEENAFHLSTHPTAGLSYLRTNSKLTNHPILGPQRSKAPVKARLISPTPSNIILGVAGFVANPEPGSKTMDFETPGGAKLERTIEKVYVDGEGKIRISTKPSTDYETLDIREGFLEPPVFDISETRGAGRIGDSILSPLDVPRAPSMAPRAQPMGKQTIDELKLLLEQHTGKKVG